MLIETIAKTVVTTAAKAFGTNVIERWSRYRAERFFEAFTEAVKCEVESGRGHQTVDDFLEKILADESKSAVLFEAYRKVCLSKSRTLGPRIIGLLTGSLVFQQQNASAHDEAVFEVAELLSDDDIDSFIREYGEILEKATGRTDSKAKYNVAMGYTYVTNELKPTRENTTGTGWVELNYGSWARILKQCGLIEETETVELIEASSFLNDIKQTCFKSTTNTSFYRNCDLLLKLAIRAKQMTDGALTSSG